MLDTIIVSVIYVLSTTSISWKTWNFISRTLFSLIHILWEVVILLLNRRYLIVSLLWLLVIYLWHRLGVSFLHKDSL
jgi:hypothetical protein